MNGIKAKTARGYFAPLADSKYMLLSTFRRNGSPVSTPVHVVVEGDAAFFRTWDVSGKRQKASPQHLCPGRSLHAAGPASGPRLSSDGGASGG